MTFVRDNPQPFITSTGTDVPGQVAHYHEEVNGVDLAERVRQILENGGLDDVPDVYQASSLGRGKPVVR